MNWYALYIKTGYEKKSEQYLKTRLDGEEFIHFVPMKEVLRRHSKEIIKEKMPLLPGYVFTKSELSDNEFFLRTKKIINESSHIIRLLSNAEANEYAMKAEDIYFIESLCNAEYCVEVSSGIVEGDRTFIKKGPLMGMEGKIKRINRHKLFAVIEMEVMGTVIETQLSLELIDKA